MNILIITGSNGKNNHLNLFSISQTPQIDMVEYILVPSFPSKKIDYFHLDNLRRISELVINYDKIVAMGQHASDALKQLNIDYLYLPDILNVNDIIGFIQKEIIN
jgi:hypothetical protein